VVAEELAEADESGSKLAFLVLCWLTASSLDGDSNPNPRFFLKKKIIEEPKMLHDKYGEFI
jgi:hypothetical protein